MNEPFHCAAFGFCLFLSVNTSRAEGRVEVQSDQMHVNNFRTALNSKWQFGQVLFLRKVVQNIQEPSIRKFN